MLVRVGEVITVTCEEVQVIVPNTSHVLTHLILTKLYEVGTTIIPIL